MLARKRSHGESSPGSVPHAPANDGRARGLWGKRARPSRPISEHEVRQSLQALLQLLAAQADIRQAFSVLGPRSVELDLAERLTSGLAAMLPHRGLYLHLRASVAPSVNGTAGVAIIICEAKIKGLPSFEIRLGAPIEAAA